MGGLSAGIIPWFGIWGATAALGASVFLNPIVECLGDRRDRWIHGVRRRTDRGRGDRGEVSVSSGLRVDWVRGDRGGDALKEGATWVPGGGSGNAGLGIIEGLSGGPNHRPGGGG